ncbi:terminase family protein [Mesorhizobium sp.]|uniref:phage terminase large subunit family protein n=1 Tax=Mesorhizobium sp. TaxID=1871066 RepID=UPI0025DC5AAF|nr:terminase family protein [Mesorhizobium sp.]
MTRVPRPTEWGEVAAQRPERGLRRALPSETSSTIPSERASPSPSRLRRATSPPLRGGEEPKLSKAFAKQHHTPRLCQNDSSREGAFMTRHVTFMTIDDAEHYTPQQRAAIVSAYPAHEREARARGIPVLGSGRIFPVAEELIACEPFRLPRYWPRLGALDFGWDHPSAAVELAWDTEADVVYVAKACRASQQTPAMQALTLKPWGEWLPWAWPRDGRRETLEGAGVALARQYAAHGLNMLSSHAQFADGSVSVEAGLMEMLDRMQSGRFKVFLTLLPWFEEFRLYHRKDGQVVKLRDDLMAATRYGVMMLRAALVDPAEFKTARRKAGQSDPLGAFR